jgi:hypothetical protein
VGVPDSTPLDEKFKPGGRVPADTVHVNVPLPPVAENCCCGYATPTVPFGRLVGATMLKVGTVIRNVTVFEETPPGLTTWMDADVGVGYRLAGTVAVNWVELTKVVASVVLFHLTVAPLWKFVPLTVRVNPLPPAAMLDGDRLLMLTVETTWKDKELEIWPVCGSRTVMGWFPTLARYEAGIVALSCVALLTVL